MPRIRRRLAQFVRERVAQDLIEYTLLLAFVALGAIGLLSQTGVGISGLWTSANSTLSQAAGTSLVSGGATTGGTGGGGGDQSGGDGH
ncbi:MAG TPA: hypothetical protein VKT49_25850 [Bryobacteraceae bacterium]|nr:hypothetical protein [Bryobacteraceae bacterium]